MDHWHSFTPAHSSSSHTIPHSLSEETETDTLNNQRNTSGKFRVTDVQKHILPSKLNLNF